MAVTITKIICGTVIVLAVLFVILCMVARNDSKNH